MQLSWPELVQLAHINFSFLQISFIFLSKSLPNANTHVAMLKPHDYHP